MAIIEQAQRTRVLAEARSWIGTPYHHQADVKRAGVDCGMLLVRVFVDLGLVAPFDPRPYPVEWHLHRGEERYLAFLGRHVRAVETPLPGDIAMFHWGRTFSHGGIVTDSETLTVIHASYPAGRVLEEPVAGTPFGARAMRFFSYWDA